MTHQRFVPAGRQLAAGVTGVTSSEFAEQTLEQLILSGKSRSEAMAMMADENFQNNVLAELSRFWEISPDLLEKASQTIQQAVKPERIPGAIELEASEIPLNQLQQNLRSLASIQEFIDNNQDKAQAIAVVLALTQGPKGVIQAVAMSAAQQTPLVQALMERIERAQEYVGNSITERLEGRPLTRDDSYDQYLMKGGNLIASIIGTGISSISAGKEIKVTENKKPVGGKGEEKSQANAGSSYPNLARPGKDTPASVILGDLDALDRPTGVTATLRADSLGNGSAAKASIRPPGFEGGPEHVRGHLLANMLGGMGDDARNLITLFQRNANHPNMSSFERQVRSAVQAGETVNYRAIPIYSGNNLMPTGVTLTARGSSGFNLDVSIPNINGVK